ncbi:nickel/cobalt transporter [Chthonobacter rhizosphaerae]|uniref:nickel/cobalt transporter n=1 Tax=Chthonobacter rhizosphaerae TaxID=2735553 RepID=UPI0015EF4FC9|nr:nickel/cobalt transporter [Chthonobacter rhizosphaerae]
MPVTTTRRPAPLSPALLAFVALALVAFVAPALAAGPFGVGVPEPAPSAGGFLPGLFGWIAAEQSRFYRSLTATVSAVKSDGSAVLWLMGLSFAYGVLHAAGPGHGKAVVSAYVLANRETARNAAVLSLLSALAQAVTAVVLVSVAALAIGATAMAMTRTAEYFEIGSFALITVLGLWLVQRKIVSPLSAAFAARYAPVVLPSGGPFAFAGSAEIGGSHHAHAHDHAHAHNHGPAHGHQHGHGHGHAHGHDHHHHHAGCGCGHAHVPSLEQAGGRLNLAKAWSTILAVGMRPCTGALIVLVFALSQGLFAAGIAATVAMALGTGLTVAALTLLAVSARGLAVRLAGDGSATGHRVHMAVEALGALLVLGFGLLMLGASLSG